MVEESERAAQLQAKTRRAALVLVMAAVFSVVVWMMVMATVGTGLVAVIAGFLLLCFDAAAVAMVWYTFER